MSYVSKFSAYKSRVITEKVEGNSETIPGQQYPLREIIEKSLQGIPVSVREVSFDGVGDDVDFDPSNQMWVDFTDVKPISEELKSRVESSKKREAEITAQIKEQKKIELQNALSSLQGQPQAGTA